MDRRRLEPRSGRMGRRLLKRLILVMLLEGRRRASVELWIGRLLRFLLRRSIFQLASFLFYVFECRENDLFHRLLYVPHLR